DIQPYVGLDQTFEIKVTAKDYDNQPIILFNQPVFVMSNLSGDLDDPDTELGSDNIGNVRGCQPSGWMSGVNTITGCRVVGDPHGTIRYFGVGYQAIGFAGQSNYLVYNVDLVTVIDPSLVDPMAFRVTINPPVTLINTDFTISLEALAWTQLPYPPIIDIDFNHSVNVSLDGFVGTLTPATIGDGTYGTWNNGVTSYDGYQIDIVGNYTIFAFWLGASGSGNIRVMDTTDPVINGILPKAEGPMTGGNIVTITGFNFGNTQGTVSFVTGHLATVNSWTDTSIQVIVPPYTSGGTGSTNGIIVDVAVHRQDGVSSGPYPYLYKPVSGTEPNILGIEPDNGLVVGGNTVTITGTNFGALLPGTVYFGGAIANINPGTWSDTEVEVTAPAGTAGTKVFVTLINASGVPSLPFDGYTYNVPAITQIDPDHGPVGTTVNITVANMILQSGVQVEFDVAPNNVLGDNITILNATTLQVDAPLHAIDSIPVDVTVKNPGYSDITQVGAFLYTSSSGVFSMAARYYSPNFAVTQLSKLDSISIIADGYSQAYTGTEVVEVALSLFKENGDPLEGTIADPTYYVFPTDSASQLTVLNNINGKPGFDEVRSMMIRIYMYTPDITLPTAEQPWATSVILNYTLANGTIGSLDFVSSNTQNLVAIDTPVTFNMEAISGQFSGSYAMKLEIEW
ncbi:IPT/TIG domain-containing protein, partial [Patescibacteria group bacterium]|nr:IPT/TIG domain-containing protein [Patescibacteria group bacterium]